MPVGKKVKEQPKWSYNPVMPDDDPGEPPDDDPRELLKMKVMAAKS